MAMSENGNSDISATFDNFWRLYPRKVARKYASDCWKRLTEAQKVAAIRAVELHAKAWAAEGRQMSVIPHASTWIHGERWEDEIEVAEVIPQKAVAWWASDEGVMAKGRELGIHAKGGEGMAQYKSRVVEAARKAA